MNCVECGNKLEEGNEICNQCGRNTEAFGKDKEVKIVEELDSKLIKAKKNEASKYGKFWIRVLALCIDFIALLILGFVFVPLLYPIIILGFEEIIAFIIVWLYVALFESSNWQATIGKRVCGLKVVDYDGNRINFGRATARFLAKGVSNLTLGIGYIMAEFTERNQALHDIIAQTLVIAKTKDESLNKKDKDLLMAIVTKDAAVAKKLINEGANPNAKDNEGVSILMGASMMGFESLVDLLIQNNVHVNDVDHRGSTALMFAAAEGRLYIVKKLLEAGANANIKNNKGNTALMVAVEEGNQEVAEELSKVVT